MPRTDHDITIEEIPPEDAEAQACMAAYYAEIAARFPMGFDVALSRDPEAGAMLRPRGAFLLARGAGPLGCGGLKGTDDGYAEIKRLWIAPEARGLGLGRALMDRLEQIALDLGITRLRLDTNSALPEAVTLYRRTGWQEIPRYNDDPHPDIFFEKILKR